ncbi:thioredoxin family protein [Catenulispora sp. GAS73]|uniref:thioredoxin family protein n=1 Tax=Catenulispora sp. GAS73 TaxID=3156269 RepID=UPI00351284B5
MASATFGLAACSATDRGREPAAASQPLSAQAEGHAGRVHAAPVAVAPAAAQGQPQGQPQGQGQGQNQQAAPGARAAAPGGAPGALGTTAAAPGTTANAAGLGPVGAPVLIPSSTTDVAPQSAHPHAAAPRPAAAPAAPALVPASPRPAPAPPSAQDPHAQDPNLAYDPTASATAQIVDAVAAAHMDGKAVLLDFGANWCTACRALDRAMHTPKAQAVLAQYYHVVHIDLGNSDPQHMALATQYAALGTFGMPLLVVLNPDGTVRADSAHVGQPKYDEAGLAAWLNQWAR